MLNIFNLDFIEYSIQYSLTLPKVMSGMHKAETPGFSPESFILIDNLKSPILNAAIPPNSIKDISCTRYFL